MSNYTPIKWTASNNLSVAGAEDHHHVLEEAQKDLMNLASLLLTSIPSKMSIKLKLLLPIMEDFKLMLLFILKNK